MKRQDGSGRFTGGKLKLKLLFCRLYSANDVCTHVHMQLFVVTTLLYILSSMLRAVAALSGTKIKYRIEMLLTWPHFQVCDNFQNKVAFPVTLTIE